MSEFDELMAEMVQTLEEALRRAVAGIATSEDWILIYRECGVNQEGKSDEFNC
jgi:hypothetical protein